MFMNTVFPEKPPTYTAVVFMLILQHKTSGGGMSILRMWTILMLFLVACSYQVLPNMEFESIYQSQGFFLISEILIIVVK